MLRLDDILAEWDKDSVIDKIELDQSSLQTACLHAKYLRFMAEAKKQLRKCKSLKSSVRRSGDDQKYRDLIELTSETEDLLDALERILQCLNQRSYTISNIVKWRMFTQGADLSGL
jgi:hypothetical protein